MSSRKVFNKKKNLDPIRKFQKRTLPIEIEMGIDLENVEEIIKKTEKENERIRTMTKMLNNQKLQQKGEVVQIPKSVFEELKNKNKNLEIELANSKRKESQNKNKISDLKKKILELEKDLNFKQSRYFVLEKENENLKLLNADLSKTLKNKENEQVPKNEEVTENLKNELLKYKNNYFEESEKLQDLKRKFMMLQEELNNKKNEVNQIGRLINENKSIHNDDSFNNELIDNLIYDYEMLSHLKEEWDGMIEDLSKYA